MKLVNKHKEVEVIFKDSLLEELSLIGVKNYPNEFGGFLVGRYEKRNKLLIIGETILPQKYKGTPNLFFRSSEGIETQFKKLYKENPSKYYIGEWHTHPNGSTNYSRTDLNAMIDIENCQTVNINNPVLLILGINKAKMTGFSLYLYDNKKLLKYE